MKSMCTTFGETRRPSRSGIRGLPAAPRRHESRRLPLRAARRRQLCRRRIPCEPPEDSRAARDFRHDRHGMGTGSLGHVENCIVHATSMPSARFLERSFREETRLQLDQMTRRCSQCPRHAKEKCGPHDECGPLPRVQRRAPMWSPTLLMTQIFDVQLIEYILVANHVDPRHLARSTVNRIRPLVVLPVPHQSRRPSMSAARRFGHLPRISSHVEGTVLRSRAQWRRRPRRQLVRRRAE